MKKYELMTIIDIDQGEEKAKNLSKNIQKIIADLGGVISKTDFWGKRKFAYEIHHKNEGFYEVINFDLNADNMSVLESKLKLLEGLVRYLITIK